jgi:DNA-binding transcriptional LysR family regulator
LEVIVELRHLRYFVAIAEERSFSRAAERLWVAQPGLSSQTKRLEAELGVQLFERHSRGVDLTDAGTLFLERARAAIAAADAAAAVGRDLEAGLAGCVRIGLATGARWRGAAAVLDRFAREHPGVEVTVVEGHGGTLWRDMRDGRLDALIAPATFGSPDLERVALGTEPWVVAAGVGHRLHGDGPVEASELQGEHVVVTAHRDGAGYDRAVAELLGDVGVTAALVGGGPGPALHGAVARGEAIALTTGPDALAPGVVARPLHPERTLAFQLLWRDEEPAPALRELIRTASEAASAAPAPRPALAAAA